MEPRCAVHPDRLAAGTCERCGAFSCAADYASVAGRWLCATCAARPDSDYLEAFRRKYWGKRDAWGWLIGVSALGHLLGLGGNIVDGQLLLAPLSLAVGAAQACYFIGFRWARGFIFAVVVELMLTPVLLLIPVSETAGMSTMSAMLGQAIIGPVVPGLICLAIFLNTRNQLFFQVPVSEGKLKKAWDLYCNNAIARSGFLLSLLGLLVPLLGAVGLVLSLIGLRRVDPKAFPPVGRKGQAIAGIVLGAVGAVGWGALFAAVWLKGA